MSEFFGFIGDVIKWGLILLAFLILFTLTRYNKLRSDAELIREAWSNIGVLGKKQVSLVNQLIDVVKGYQESEKLVVLKVSEDLSTANSIAQMHQQAGMVLSTVSGMEQRYPELKADQQYRLLIEAINKCELGLQSARETYNAHVRGYNTQRSKLPTVLFASTLGFKAAPYLEFVGNEQVVDMGSVNSFSADADGDRLNALLGAAGSQAKRIGTKALSSGMDVASKAIAGTRVLVETAQDKARQAASNRGATVFHYLDRNRNPAGPIALADLHGLFAAGEIDAHTPILPAGATEWIRYEAIMPPAAGATSVPPSETPTAQPPAAQV